MAPSELYMNVDSMCTSSVAVGCPIFIVGKAMPLLLLLLTVAIGLYVVNPPIQYLAYAYAYVQAHLGWSCSAAH